MSPAWLPPILLQSPKSRANTGAIKHCLDTDPGPSAGTHMDELGREAKPHTWLQPSVGLAGFCLAQNLLQVLWSSAAVGDNSLCTSVHPGEQRCCSAACTAGCQLTEKISHIFSLPMDLPSPQATLQAAERAGHHQLNNQAVLPRQPFPSARFSMAFNFMKA